MVLFDQALVSGGNFLLGTFLARQLGVETYGTFALLWMAVLLLLRPQLRQGSCWRMC